MHTITVKSVDFTCDRFPTLSDCRLAERNCEDYKTFQNYLKNAIKVPGIGKRTKVKHIEAVNICSVIRKWYCFL